MRRWIVAKIESEHKKFPTWTVIILLLSVLVYVLPGAAALFVYDRAGIAKGEVWRLLTSSLVHFTSVHLFYNLIAFGIAGWIIEQRGYRYFLILCTLMALSISSALFVMKPDMHYYGGLSGLACGAVIYLALFGLGEKRLWRRLCLLTLVVVSIKIGIEIFYGQITLPYGGRQSFMTMPLSHAMGSLVALLFFLFVKIRSNR